VIVVRTVTEADVPAVDAVLSAAFGGEQVPRLVHALRAAALQAERIELVAEDAGEVVGHVLVTPIPLETAPGATTSLACLSPLGVRPDASGRGIGSALVRAALAEAARRGEPAVVLEGDPAYYRRFGFVPALSLGLTGAWDALGDAWQALVLPGAPAPQPGEVIHPSPWHDL
jgi:putative acetyltransferase